MFYFLMYLVNPYSQYWKFSNRHAYDLSIEFGAIMVTCYLMLEMSIFVDRKLNDLLPWQENALLRGTVQITAQLSATLILLNVMRVFIFYVFFSESRRFTDYIPTVIEQIDRWRYNLAAVGMTIFLNSALTSRYFLNRWRNSMVEAAELKLHAAELKEIAMQAELQSLKLQLDPHFMFNNFSTLSELISEDRELAQKFIEHLSRVYRYMIMNIHYNIIHLHKELKFIQSYIYLVKIRHGDNVVIDIDVPDHLLEKQLPPITLQLLLENAIKHNMATPSQPLHIRITVDDRQRLVVYNNLQRIEVPGGNSSKLGLQNIRERYRLVSGQVPEIQISEESFRVCLPLLD
jgi:sensor histidine kinase YesM